MNFFQPESVDFSERTPETEVQESPEGTLPSV